ncbi:hypothetical protein B0I35DRAFT_443962 [Stachybotrys elegans]|uniref:Secreted protein n=1 Tax=Stachybotrys elegans TaxID=80388 RepID=A0A8K0SBE0_9HYPO|nr:hypothetical protein B0I35DRAFT_443962 [Stachybotrys elegans]
MWRWNHRRSTRMVSVMLSWASHTVLTSGGDFCRHFPAPAYQRAALVKYEELVGVYLRELVAVRHYTVSAIAGRGYPHVSVLASAYLIYPQRVYQCLWHVSL